MQIYLYSRFMKRENSTKTPTDTTLSYKTEGYLKDPSSVINPTLIINHMLHVPGPNPNLFVNYTYAYIPDFKRYYFIDDIISEGKLWTLTMHCDVLASFKDQIEQHPFYVLRSSNKYNGLIADTYYPVTFERKSYIKNYNTLWKTLSYSNLSRIDITEGCFILGIVAKPSGTGSGSYGSIKYYALKQSELKNLVMKLLDNTVFTDNGFNTSDATLSLQKSLVNPLSWIKSCMYLPVSQSLLPGLYQNYLNVWDWSLDDVDCRVLTGNTPYYEAEQTALQIHQHPQAGTRGKYLNAAPYTRISLLYPPFGLFDIDTSELVNGGNLNVAVNIDYITGLGTLDIYATVPAAEQMSGSQSAANLLQRIKAQVGVPIQLSEVGYDYTNMALTLVGGGIELIQSQFSQYLDSSIQNGLSQIGSAVNAMRTKASTIGSNGGFSELDGDAVLYEEYFTIVDEDLTHLGRPLCKFLRLSEENTGYYLMRDGDMEILGATYPELMSVKSYLEGGIFYE